MPIYTIEAPDGRVLDVEGPREPTQDEAALLFEGQPKAPRGGGAMSGLAMGELASRVGGVLVDAWNGAEKVGEALLGGAGAATEEAKNLALPVRGAVIGTGLAIQGVSEAGQGMAIDPMTGLVGLEKGNDPRGNLLYRAGKAVEDFGKAIPAPADRGFGADVAEGIGQVVPAIAAGLATRSPVVAGLVVGGATETADAYAREMDRQEESGEPLDFGLAYDKAIGYGLASGAIEAKLGAGRIVKRVQDALAGKVRLSGVKQLVLGRMADAGAGFTEEATQRAIQDLIVEGKLDKEGIAQEGGVGAVVQAILGLPAAAIAYKSPSKDPAAEAFARKAEQAGLSSTAEAIREHGDTIASEPGAAEFEALVSQPIEEPKDAVQEQAAAAAPGDVLNVDSVGDFVGTGGQTDQAVAQEGQTEVTAATQEVTSEAQGQVQEEVLDVAVVPGEVAAAAPGAATTSETQDGATAAITGYLGTDTLPEGVTVVSDPSAPWAGKIENGRVVVNAAQVQPGNAPQVVLEEGLHGVWGDPELAEAWRGWRQAVTPQDVRSERERRVGLDTSEPVLQEEAAIRRFLENRPADQGVIRRIYEAVRAAMLRLFGVRVPNTAEGRQLLEAAAKRYLTRRLEAGGAGPTRFAAPQVKPSQGYFKGDYETRPDAVVSAEADTFLGRFATESEAIGALENPTTNIPGDTRAQAAGILGDRLAQRYYGAEDPGEQAAARRDLIRLAALGVEDSRKAGQTLRARQPMIDKLLPHAALLSYLNLVNETQRTVVDEVVDVPGVVDQVNTELDKAGEDAVDAIDTAVRVQQTKKKRKPARRAPQKEGEQGQQPEQPGETEEQKESKRATATADNIISRLAKSQSDTHGWSETTRNQVEEAVRRQLTEQAPKEGFASVLVELGVKPETAARLSELVAREIEVRRRVEEAKQDERIADEIGDATKIAALLDKAGVEEGVNWSELFQSSLKDQKARQKEFFDRIQNDPRFARLNPTQRAELANTLFRAWELERLRVFRREFERLIPGDPKTPQERAVKAVLPRLIKLANLGILDADAARNEIARLYGMDTLDGPLAEEIKRLSQEAQKHPNGSIAQGRVFQKIHEALATRSNLPLDKILADYWYSNVLGRTSTWLNVLLGSATTGLWAQALQSGAVAVGRRAPMDAARMWQAWFNSFSDAIAAGIYIAYSGDRSVVPGFSQDIAKALSMKDTVKAADTFELMLAKARKEGKPFKARYAYTAALAKRVMTALDLVGSMGAGDAARFLAAHNLGDQESLAKLRANLDKRQTKQAEQQARAELGPKAPRAVVAARRREILEEGISREVLDAAEHVRRRVAANADPHGIGGYLYRLVRNTPFMFKSFAGLQFIRAAANMTNWVSDAIPGVGLVKYAQSKLPQTSGLFSDLTPEDQSLAVAAQVAGLAVIAGAAAMFLNDDEEDDGWDISGSWAPLTPQRKKLLRDKGESPYTITTPYGTISYKQMAGLNAPLALVGTLRDQQKHDKENWDKDGALAKLFHAWLFGSIGVIKDLNTITSITDVFGRGASGPVSDEQEIGRIANFLTRMGSGFIPFKGAISEIDGYLDRKKYLPDKDDVIGQLLRNIPVARRTVKSGADYNLFGEPISVPANLLKNWVNITEAPEEWGIAAALAQKGTWLSEASLGNRSIVDAKTGEKRPMDLAEKQAFAQARGQYIKTLLLENKEELLAKDKEELAKWWEEEAKKANKQGEMAAEEVAFQK